MKNEKFIVRLLRIRAYG